MATNAVAVRELPDKLTDKPPKGWSVNDLWGPMLDLFKSNKSKDKKIAALENKVEVIEVQEAIEHDPQHRLVMGVAEAGFALAGGFANPFLVSLLGPDWQKLPITEDFGIDVEAITAAGLGGLGLFLHWRDWEYGRWVFESGKGAAAAYVGHIGRQVGARLASPAAEAST